MYKQYYRIVKVALILSIMLHTLLLSTPSHAQITPTPNPSTQIPAEFNQHYIYQSILPVSSSVETRLGWDINVMFVDNQIEAEWIVRVEQKPASGTWQVTDDFVKKINCSAMSDLGGNGPDIINGVANFNAFEGDYFVCDIPSFEDAATQLIDAFLDPNSYFYTQNLNNNPTSSGAVLKQTERNRKIGKPKPPTKPTHHNYETNEPIFSALYDTFGVIDFVCTGCIDFWGAAEFEWNSISNHAPLLHLVNEEISFAYDLHKNSGAMEPQINVSGLSNPVTILSPSSVMVTAQHLVWSGQNPQRFYSALDTRFNSPVNESTSKLWAGLWLGRALLSDLVAVGEQLDLWFSGIENTKGIRISKQDIFEYDFSVKPLKLYIGHNPQGTGTYFNGSMTQVGVDPGCSPH